MWKIVAICSRNFAVSTIISSKILLSFSGAFEDSEVTHVEGEVDPVRDLEIIYEELRLKDEETLGKTIEKLEKLVVRGNDKKSKPEYVSRNYQIELKIHSITMFLEFFQPSL